MLRFPKIPMSTADNAHMQWYWTIKNLRKVWVFQLHYLQFSPVFSEWTLLNQGTIDRIVSPRFVLFSRTAVVSRIILIDGGIFAGIVLLWVKVYGSIFCFRILQDRGLLLGSVLWWPPHHLYFCILHVVICFDLSFSTPVHNWIHGDIRYSVVHWGHRRSTIYSSRLLLFLYLFVYSPA